VRVPVRAGGEGVAIGVRVCVWGGVGVGGGLGVNGEGGGHGGVEGWRGRGWLTRVNGVGAEVWA